MGESSSMLGNGDLETNGEPLLCAMIKFNQYSPEEEESTRTLSHSHSLDVHKMHASFSFIAMYYAIGGELNVI